MLCQKAFFLSVSLGRVSLLSTVRPLQAMVGRLASIFNKQMTQILVLHHHQHHRIAGGVVGGDCSHSPISFHRNMYVSSFLFTHLNRLPFQPIHASPIPYWQQAKIAPLEPE